MKFDNYEYKRPDVEETKTKLENYKKLLSQANNYNEFIKVFKEYNKFLEKIATQSTLVSIRNSLDTTDKFYEDEQEFWNEFSPEITAYESNISKIIYNSQFKEELKNEIGEHYFNLIECDLKIFKDEILEDLKEENKLQTEYVKLTSSAKISFDGQEHNLSGMAKYTQADDREIRTKANNVSTKFFEDNLEKYDDIYDRMIKVRTRIAKKLGFENFVDLAYLRLRRTDYTSKEAAGYRKQILENVVPLVEKIKKDQVARLGLDKLNFQDEAIMFKTGNPKPKGDREFLVNNAITMYRELSEETAEFFDFMVDKNLLDLDTKEGKAGGGYCTYIPDYRSPFIFANFNGTPHDVEVLTHEAGHAFQVFRSRDVKVPSYIWPTYEACENHSMSMEFLTWSWMDLFFEEDTEKFKYYHIASSLKFLPYGVTVDEFQHFVYENPKLSPKERRDKWLEIEKKYLPSRSYEDVPSLNNGMFFYRQAHLFTSPFYYIDYTLAQVCAFQFWKKANQDTKVAWKEYLHLCDLGGTKPFLELVKEANLENPFVDGTISNITPELEKYLNSVDTSKF
ncbi:MULTISPECIES: M3 family oligoendopeptidase [unclassified Gemella]|uniref:M3 family oligoendopeptidase n=1 Tax=unclassified Gemella TaxID=2624949 RepID=UPI001C0524D9|nr:MULTISPECIES: M3 family oligoendopeptidase [unclassified Gemella]MBU0278648.1 M3 family oligoendopeptidase [Gemella sp. zg-1178]QWQ39204.1 M3 family oligoendopeptidase [Gemella sp. zg-570]